jgi:hypothetical protein
MPSLTRVDPSKANDVLPKGPSNLAVTLRSTENAIIHAMCADCIVLEDEERQNFLNLLQQHVNHFRPVDEVEFGLVEEMCAARWRQRRAWSIETRVFDNQTAQPSDGDSLDRMVVAFDSVAAAPSLSLLHRYETRLNLTYQRTLRTLIMLRNLKAPNDPSPISEHPDALPDAIEDAKPPDQQPAEAELVGTEALGSACFTLYQSLPRPAYATAAKPATAQTAAPPLVQKSGGAM